MAAYAALVSVMNIIETIQNHPRPPISLDREQVLSLTEKVSFLQDFLEGHSGVNINGGGSEDVEGFESRIADAAYEAEDVIESHIADQIEATTNVHGETIKSSLEKMIQGFDVIKRDVSDFTKKMGLIQHSISGVVDGSLRTSSTFTGKDTVVGLDDALIEVMDKLTGRQSSRQIIPIVGMGGIGKTTLARSIYENPLIVQYFYFRCWATISQEYNSKEILREVLICLNIISSGESFGEEELGDKLYKCLFGRRYLIVMDDIWSIEAWYKLKTFFPDNNDGSAIMLTTRLSSLAFQLSGSYDSFEMSFLDEDNSWNLFRKSVFGEESCPHELEGIGKKIVENCKGLPLSIIVVGGLLAKSERTREYWLYIVENLNSIVNLEEDERCSRILSLSYNHLPVHLKPCFLYMGVFPEDYQISVPHLMKLWVSEGFLKPISGKLLEIVADEYFNDLFDRNLVLVSKRGCSGKIKYCKIHDLLIDLCVREAQKHKFLYVTKRHILNNPQEINTQRRIAVHEGDSEVIDALSSTSLVRSLTCKYSTSVPTSFNSSLLRVWDGSDKTRENYDIFHDLGSTSGVVNCRYIFGLSFPVFNPIFPPSICLLWNLQTLIVQTDIIKTSEIWKMPQLRHVKFNSLILLDPPRDDGYVLWNLQTLKYIINTKLSEEVVKRIPNIKKLCLVINYDWIRDKSSRFSLNNLARLLKLESLVFSFGFGDGPHDELENLTFPRSLKKLDLISTRLQWKEMATKIGCLPHLRVLKLQVRSFIGAEWETVEGQFCSLKYLEISRCFGLEYWRTESTHFPCLEHLVLEGLSKLKEIPLEIGEISTLKSIELEHCSESAIISAKEIITEQEDLGNFDLQVRVQIFDNNEAVESLASPNFQVQITNHR